MKEISISNLLLLKNIFIIDIRDSKSFLKKNIPNSINISEIELKENPEKYLSFDLVYYIYCAYGGCSFFLCNRLTKLGYKVVNIQGGFKEYLLYISK